MIIVDLLDFMKLKSKSWLRVKAGSSILRLTLDQNEETKLMIILWQHQIQSETNLYCPLCCVSSFTRQISKLRSSIHFQQFCNRPWSDIGQRNRGHDYPVAWALPGSGYPHLPHWSKILMVKRRGTTVRVCCWELNFTPAERCNGEPLIGTHSIFKT